MKTLFLPVLVLVGVVSSGQSVSWLTNLDQQINETSGLIFLNQKFITHNDSGGEPALYEIDTSNGHVTRAVYLQNANNIDWEDIAIDGTYIYIGDFGNNYGNRTDLKIYRVSISDYTTTPNDTVQADIIHFSYGDQVDFTPANMATNFDAEALIATTDSLYLFTKNWKNSWTNVYSIPNTPGTYYIYKKDSLDVKGYITGATYNGNSQTITLLGYTFLSPPFIVKIKGFNGNGSFSNATLQKTTLPFKPSYSRQTEGICHLNDNEFYISAEELQGNSAALFRLNIPGSINLTELSKKETPLYPNPVSKILNLNNPGISQAEIYSERGILLLKSSTQKIDVSELKDGTYIIIMTDTEGKTRVSKIVIN